MANIMDYLHWRGDLPLAAAPFNPVDNLILAWFAMIPLDGISADTVAQAWEALKDRTDLPKDDLALLRAMSAGARFAPMRLVRYESLLSEEEQMQFAAVTILTGDGMAFVAFRGTDSTLIGWKEDLNMGFEPVIPAQRESARYLAEVARALGCPLRVGGHSKGGNLAVYAASQCGEDVQARIAAVYNNDGPGLNAQVMESEGYLRVEERIHTYLPQSSLVGILFEHTSRFQVVRAASVGIMQHYPHTWQVGPADFVIEGGLRRGALNKDRALRAWIGSMTVEERRIFVEAIYQIASASGANTLHELVTNWRKSGPAMLAATAALDARSRRIAMQAIGSLIALSAQGMRAAPALPEEAEEVAPQGASSI